MSSFLHLAPNPFTILPSHPSLDNDQARHSPRGFQSSTLADADSFLASVSTTFHKQRKPRHSPPATAPVHVSSRTIRTGQKEEFWVCRNSIHQDVAVDGSASWEEFQSGLKENHTMNEMEYTPSVTGVERLLDWPREREIEGGWREVDMSVNLITHTFHPTTLISPRSFIVLVICAALPISRGKGFVTIQIPLSGKLGGSAPNLLRERITALAPQNTVFASYASVEQVVVMSDKVEWTMATTSNAGGAIPQWIQRSWTLGGVPKAIVADVGLFIAWMAQRRSQCNQRAHIQTNYKPKV
ncbi:hypothetical protein BDV26DRAFT_262006 [Aspergillus bertholletiae]|uniref:DUF3074 domain-containing protein n=1 Tax=Aspergillus bertholletiae TaxID=1226010 RepID=A0A5N7B908_9EURO|nr:hypothetical protein BDV26DRAFT_262006 [Aspergillus bertholletiae]